MPVGKTFIDKIMMKVLEKAKDAEQAAGMNGSMSDGGAGVLRTQVAFYKLGMAGYIPNEWGNIAKEIENEADPEFETYQRLQKKFGAK